MGAIVLVALSIVSGRVDDLFEILPAFGNTL